jgi:outer membrane lipoprotein LolB
MLKKIILFFTCIYLAGCSFQSTQPQIPNINTISWEEHQSMLKEYLSWELSGKVGIRTNENSQSASLVWLQERQHYQIDIHGPWGQGGASITGMPGDVTVNVSGGEQFKGSNPEFILYNELGWELPINDIYWWIRGLPSPETPYTHNLENNRLKSLQQRGWDIQYIRYNTLTPALPNKVRLIRNELKITVIVNSWIKR